jgi:hypothetical protein
MRNVWFRTIMGRSPVRLERTAGPWRRAEEKKPTKEGEEMTEADKTEIASLLATQKTLAKVGQKADEPYFNEGVSDYAKAAIADAKEIKKFVIDTLQNNLELFFCLNDFRISTSTIWETGDFYKKGEYVVVLGGLLHVRLRFKIYEDSHVYHTSGKFISAKPEDVEVKDFFVHTSDTDMKIPDWEYKDERIYGIICWDDLFWHNPKSYNLKMQKPGGWSSIKGMADRTRKVSALAVYALRKVITNNIGSIRRVTNEREKTRDELGKVPAYAKVSVG